jgi:tetratricopeptide (TPR) repeat protein
MNRWRIVGLIVLALLAGSLLVWWLKPAPPPVAPTPPPAREVFHSSKPLRIEVASTRPPAETAWLDYELRHLLNRGRMRVTPIDETGGFALRVTLNADANGATLALLAPDGVVEREEQVQLPTESRLATISALAKRLPQFLNAQPAGSPDWVALIGTDDAKAYDAYLADALELLGPNGPGLTRPGMPQSTRTVDGLESLTRHQPHFARARAALAIGYLSLGGQDEASLSKLAKTTAERALAADDGIAEAHAALGLVHMRSGDWTAAREQFDRALALDANSAAALEGSGCLLVDAGRYEAARPLIEHAVRLQPRNIGALECLAYLNAAAAVTKVKLQPDPKTANPPSAVARVEALASILAGDVDTARGVLRESSSDEEFREWAEPLLQAATDRKRVPDALQSITRAASDRHIDASTEILCGAALRRAEFVFNRMARLQRDHEPVPLRLLWMPQTAFLRRHARFEQIVGAAGLPAFWQEYGTPDTCAAEPQTYGCKTRTTGAQAREP